MLHPVTPKVSRLPFFQPTTTSMSDFGAPPVIPAPLQQYNSHIVDPQWQSKFTIVWSSALGVFVLFYLPRLLRSIRHGRLPSTLSGISDKSKYSNLSREDDSFPIASATTSDPESTDSNALSLLPPSEKLSIFGRARSSLSVVTSFGYLTLPAIRLNVGQLIIIISYLILVVVCTVVDAPLHHNPNRPAYIALAQLPVLLLFGSKNTILSFLLGPGNGYEKLNFIHKWSGRAVFLCCLLHGTLWVRNHWRFGFQMLSRPMVITGLAGVCALSVIVITSLAPFRRFCYQIFFLIHYVAFISFFTAIYFHTRHALPWIFPSLALYGIDVVVRVLHYRIKDAVLIPVGEEMTLIHIPRATSGWIAGQHIRLRVFSPIRRILESHPLTILSAPPDISCITSLPPGLSLGVRACGDWSKALSHHALTALSDVYPEADEPKDAEIRGQDFQSPEDAKEIPVRVMIDGPYGGCSLDLGEYEAVLLFAGGAGATFTLAILDDIVGRCVRQGRKNGEVTRRIEFVWCVRSLDSLDWFAPALIDISNAALSSSSTTPPIDMHISVYVTSLCNSEAVPPIPNCDVAFTRPSVHRLLSDLTDLSDIKNAKYMHETFILSNAPSDLDVESDKEDLLTKSHEKIEGGRVAVCASGPDSLIQDTSNAVARLNLSRGVLPPKCIDLHTESFAL